MLFSFGGDTGETYESIQRKRKLADALIAQSAQAPRNIGEGISAIGNALAGGLVALKARKDEAKGREEFGRIFDELIKPTNAPATPMAAPAPEPAYAPEQFRDAISSVESSGRYDAVGPDTGKGRAYGKYQVMDFNVGPWTEEVLGQAMTPEQFLASPEAQDAVFDAKFGQSVAQYGNPQDAASVWFSGRPMADAKNASDGYTTVPEYVDKFNTALGDPVAPEAPAQVQASPGIDPRLLAAMGNPWASPQQMAVINALVQQQILHNKPPEPMTAYQKEQLRLRQAELDAKISGKIKTGTTVNVGGEGETAFAKETAKGQAQLLTGWAEKGAEAQAELAQIETLGALMADGAGGPMASWQAWARDSLGINTLNSREEAINAIVSKLIPAQRPPGSGTMTDGDVALFRSSLPSLLNSPEGNAIILETMRGMAQYKRQLGEISSQAIIGTRPDGTSYSRHDAMKDIYALPDPLEAFRATLDKPKKDGRSAGSTAAPAGEVMDAPPYDQSMADIGISEEEWPLVWKNMSPEDRALWQN